MKIKREEIIWLAGLLEGEGWFSVGTQPHRKGKLGRKYPRVGLNMTDRDVVEHARKASGNLGTKVYRVKSPSRLKGERERGWNPIYIWAIQSQWEAYALMVMVYPWMGKRRKQRIRELIELFKIYKPRPHLLAPDNQKWCPLCKTYKYLSEFGVSRDRVQGVTSRCRVCTRTIRRERDGVKSADYRI